MRLSHHLVLVLLLSGLGPGLSETQVHGKQNFRLLTAFPQGVTVTAILDTLWLFVQDSSIASDPLDHTRHLLSRGKSKAGITFLSSYSA